MIHDSRRREPLPMHLCRFGAAAPLNARRSISLPRLPAAGSRCVFSSKHPLRAWAVRACGWRLRLDWFPQWPNVSLRAGKRSAEMARIGLHHDVEFALRYAFQFEPTLNASTAICQGRSIRSSKGIGRWWVSLTICDGGVAVATFRDDQQSLTFLDRSGCMS